MSSQFAIRFVAALATLAPCATAQAPLYDIPGSAGDEFGHCIAPLGDLNGDGFGDVAIGSPRADKGGGILDTGSAMLTSGKTGYPLWIAFGDAPGDLFGYSVDLVGDLDLDGVGDLIVGAPGCDGPLGPSQGRIYLLSGANGSTIWLFPGVAPGDFAGWSVTGMGDVNSDGIPDYAWSAPRYDSGWNDAGGVWITDGATHLTLSFNAGSAPGVLHGWSIDGIGDRTGDGIGDLAVGEPFASPPRALDYSGASGTLHGSVAGIWNLGYSVAALGDIDGDGLVEYAVGGPDLYGSGEGFVMVAPSSGLVIPGLPGSSPGNHLGYSVAGVGDVNGDGIADLAVGSPGEDPFGLLDRGVARVYSGADLPNNTWTQLYASYGYADGDEMGREVSGAGYVNADSFADFITAAPVSDTNGTDSGWAHFVLGSAPSPVVYCTAKINSAGCTPKIFYTGCPSMSVGDNFHLHASDVLANVSGILIWSFGSASIPFGGGTLCLAGPVNRMPGQFSGGSIATPCSGTFDQAFGHAQLQLAGATPGQHLYFQYWSRDNGFASPNNMNLTNALDVIVLP